MIPRTLSKESKKIFKTILKEWDLDESGKILLKTALEGYDEYREARKQLQTEGYTITNPKTGVMRKHPALEVLKIARSQFLQAWRMLNLDIPPP